ncbi:glycoside hydrolase family 9 protein [Synoicihabitans lomoniglobus]|uniref:Glycoside hydrolase family 9 protein n=1 Tax=Synoicihabitans lomoniglobus TaxID=2909285 RepID=A0AAF0CNW6_9BACT|nr:glycoside hydrolase family 9 protein [Opitutaceae bacterium LMO-M01]WED65166.1 glycoside hydrolase family 9 protein [Opitutaceae bacterium LMO-M01]
MRVLGNHLGYEPEAVKRLWIEASADTAWKAVSLVRLPEGKVVWTGQPVLVGGVPGWSLGPWWEVDVSRITQLGRYALRWECADGAIGQGEGFAIERGLFGAARVSDLLFHIKSQRSSGVWDAADARAPRLDDRESRDVSGGWFDASGDNSKYLSHLSYAQVMNPQQNPLVVWVLARSWQRYRDAGRDDYFTERLRDEALHGADWLMRMQDESGFFYTTVFDRWSKDPAQRELCSYRTQQGHKGADYQAGWRQGGGMAIAALAVASTLGGDGAYSSEDYRAAALRGFHHLVAHGRDYLEDGTENLIDHICALLAAAELRAVAADDGAVAFELTVRWQAVVEARRETEGHVWLAMDAAGERSWFHASDAGLPVVTLQRAAELHPAHSAADEGTALAREWMVSQVGLAEADNNPFGYPPHWVQTPGRPGQPQWFYPHDNPSGYWWQGENAKLASLAAAATELAPAASQRWLDWIMGANPFDVCMMQGHGRNNPAYEDGSFNAPGGVCNGITSGLADEADIAFQPLPHNNDPAQRWRWGEQWLPHAAWLLYAWALRDTAPTT